MITILFVIGVICVWAYIRFGQHHYHVYVDRSSTDDRVRSFRLRLRRGRRPTATYDGYDNYGRYHGQNLQPDTRDDDPLDDQR